MRGVRFRDGIEMRDDSPTPKHGGFMGDDAEYQMEQDQLEKSEQESLRQARVDEDARRNRKWEQAAAAKAKPGVPAKPRDA